MSPGSASQPNQPAESSSTSISPCCLPEWTHGSRLNGQGLGEAVMNDLVLGLIAVAAFILFHVVAWRVSARSQQCPRCHQRIPRQETKCPNCGWLDKEALRVGI
jgi:hypothetical protein